MPPTHNVKHPHPTRWLFLAFSLILLITACRTPSGPVPTAAIPTGTPTNPPPTLEPTATEPMPTATTAPPTASPTPTTAPPTPQPTATEPASTATLDPSRSVVQNAESQQRWREDLQLLAERANVLHPDFTYLTSAEEFAALVAQIDAGIPYHTDNQIIAGFIRLVARSDGHSRLQPHGGEEGFHLYDLQLYQFGDDLYVVAAAPSQQEAIGAKLLAIGDLPADDVRALLEPLVAHENDMFVANYLPLFAVTPELLAALDIVQDPAQPAFLLEDAAGSRFTLHPPILDLPETLNLAQSFEQLLLPQRPELLYLSRHREQRFWHTFLEQDNTLYVQYNLVQPTTQTGQSIVGFVSALEESLQENDVARVVLDLRHNMGGELGYQEPLLEWLQAYDAANPGALYVLIGRQTFSAAAYLTAQLEQTTAAVFVGEPTGSQPNFFANSRRILLPNSGLTAHVSTRYFEPSTPGDDRPWIAPDIAAPPSAEAYFNGRDPALEALP